MKVLILNNDFPGYWKGRITYLREFLAKENVDLQAVELFGKGSPYFFDHHNNLDRWWTCLFPDQSADELSGMEIKNGLFSLLDKIKPDIIIASSIVFFAGALGIRWAKANERRFIMFDDAKPTQVKRNFIVQYIKNLIIAQSDALWLPSNDYNESYAYFFDKGLHVFYGFDCMNNDQFKINRPRRLNHNVIICVARLVPIKNIDN